MAGKHQCRGGRFNAKAFLHYFGREKGGGKKENESPHGRKSLLLMRLQKGKKKVTQGGDRKLSWRMRNPSSLSKKKKEVAMERSATP